MSLQSIICFPFFLWTLLLCANASVEGAEEIVLPEILAIELPNAQMNRIAPHESPLKELLESASAAGAKVTHDCRTPLPLGGTKVTWTAWQGEPNQSRARVTRSAYVYVLPFGQTPIGLSATRHATAGNHAAKVVRDKTGGLHAVWLDGGKGRPGYRILYRHGISDLRGGMVRWESSRVVSDGATEGWGSYAAIDVSEQAIHITWTTSGTGRYRRLLRSGNDWRFDPIRDTRATGSSHDNGPDIAARSDNEVHVLTPTGSYAVSKDGGLSWTVDTIPIPTGARLKNPALAVDSVGNAHFVFVGQIRNAENWSEKKPNRGYWELRYVRRETGVWVDAHNLLAAFPSWNDPKNDWDLLSDWPAIAIDTGNNIHVVWHGTVNTHIFANDEAFYSRRRAAGGKWAAWSEPRSLHPINVPKKEYFSFAPSLAVDDNSDSAFALVFYDTTPGEHLLDYNGRVLRAGEIVGPPLSLSQLARSSGITAKNEALSSWFPVVGPRLFRDANGRVWADILTTVATPEKHQSAHLIVFQSADVTQALRTSK